MTIYVGKVDKGIVDRRPVSMKTDRKGSDWEPLELRRALNAMLSRALEENCGDLL